MPNLAPDEIVTVIVAAVVIFAAGFLNAAGEAGWKSIQARLRRGRKIE